MFGIVQGPGHLFPRFIPYAQLQLREIVICLTSLKEDVRGHPNFLPSGHLDAFYHVMCSNPLYLIDNQHNSAPGSMLEYLLCSLPLLDEF